MDDLCRRVPCPPVTHVKAAGGQRLCGTVTLNPGAHPFSRLAHPCDPPYVWHVWRPWRQPTPMPVLAAAVCRSSRFEGQASRGYSLMVVCPHVWEQNTLASCQPQAAKFDPASLQSCGWLAHDFLSRRDLLSQVASMLSVPHNHQLHQAHCCPPCRPYHSFLAGPITLSRHTASRLQNRIPTSLFPRPVSFGPPMGVAFVPPLAEEGGERAVLPARLVG